MENENKKLQQAAHTPDVPANTRKALRAKIADAFPEAAGRLYENEPMAAHSSFRVGGPADLVFLPAAEEEIRFAAQSAKSFGVGLTVLGNGSNILVSDKGIRGMVLILGEPFSAVERASETALSAKSGALLSTAARTAARMGLSGMEFAGGIPGSVGGAVFMNAGAYDGCMADIVTKTRAYDPGKDFFFEVETAEAHGFGYRKSIYAESGAIILRAWLSLRPSDPELIERKMADFMVKRKNSQPLEFPSAGSAFKRPAGYFAGRLIEQAGLKGCRVGGACVSPKHAGFIVNDRKATAGDILRLIETVRDRVYQDCGVSLDPEIRILGEW